MKSYVKLSSGLLLSGIGAIALERAVAGGLASANLHLPTGSGWVLSALTLLPLALIAAGVLVYLGGAVFGLK